MMAATGHFVVSLYVMPKVKKPIQLLIFVGFCLSAGAIGSIFTTSAIPAWYATLVKPTFSPPNWIFAPVWTTLYILMGISAYLVWVKKNKNSKSALNLFWIQLVANIAWSYLFFGLQNPLLGLLWIILLWCLIISVIYKFSKIDKWAAYLLYPYIAWVSFAMFLNSNIWFLNK